MVDTITFEEPAMTPSSGLWANPIGELDMKTVIFDLDGTLANNDHRLHYIRRDKPDWNSYIAICGQDSPIQPVIDILNAFLDLNHMETNLTSGQVGIYNIQIWTGRDVTALEDTWKWLEKHTYVNRNKQNITLRMRDYGDRTSNDRLKQSWLSGISGDIHLAFDDNPTAIDMFRSFGIIALQVSNGWVEQD